VAALVHQLIQGLIGRGRGDDDFAALLEPEASAGLELVSEMRTYPTGWTQLARMRIVLDNSDPGTVTTDYTQRISQDHVNVRSGPFSPLLTAPAHGGRGTTTRSPRARAVCRRS
jgi:hypothetical protein